MADIITVTKPNTLLMNTTVARVIVQAPGFRAVRVRAVGTGKERTNVGLFDFTHPKAAGRLTDCIVEPETPNLWLTGVLGHDYTAVGTEVRHTVDGFGVYNTHKPAGNNVNVVIDTCLVDDLMYFTHDPNHPDRHTHNDAVQVQGGVNVTIRNSTLRALLANTGPWGKIATGQAIGITPNVSAVSVLITANKLNGGAQPITAIPTPHGATVVISKNTFGRTSHTKRAAALHPGVKRTWTGNVWTDGTAASPTITKDM